MQLSTHLQAMARNNAWSNHRLLRACSRLSPGELEAKRTSFFPSLQLTLNHILIVDWYYLDALEGGGRGMSLVENEVPCPRFAELDAAQRESDRRLVRYCDGLGEEALADIVTIDRGPDGLRREVLSAMLTHLFVHQIHHRGQAHAMLSGTSVEPPQLDEFFLAGDAHLREAELRELGF